MYIFDNISMNSAVWLLLVSYPWFEVKWIHCAEGIWCWR